MGLLVFLSLGLLWSYLQVNLNQLLNQQADTFGQAIARQIAESTAELVMAEDEVTLNTMMASVISQNENILRIDILDDQGETLAFSQRPGLMMVEKPVSANIAHYETNVNFHDVVAGHVLLQLDKSPITNSVKSTIKMMSILASLVGIFLLGFAAFIANRLTRPMRELGKVANEVASGNLSPALPKTGNNEAGDLVASFDNMLQGLKDKKSIEHRFSSYVSQDIAHDILSDLSQTRMPLKPVYGSVLFIDIVGFTTLCEEVSPQEVADILDQYYFLVNQAAKMYQGTVDKFIGDGAMITFGVNRNDPRHSINGVCAAQIFLRLAAMMNEQRQLNHKPNLHFHLGLHCGEMLAGTIGHTERMQFTVVGDAVNIAARLCSLGTPDHLLISEDVCHHPEAAGLIETGPVQCLQLKGKTDAINTYSVLNLAPKFNRLLKQQQSEMEAMQAHG